MKKNTNTQTVTKMFKGWTAVLTLMLLIGVAIFGNAFLSGTDSDYSKVGLLIGTNIHHLDASWGFYSSLGILALEFFLIKYLDVPGR